MSISISSINQSASTYQSTNVSSQEKCREKQIIKESESANAYDAVSSHGDTLTISESGKSASTNMNNQSGMDSESGNSTDDLSNYTETELKQMYNAGDITKSEYDEEISNRETKH